MTDKEATVYVVDVGKSMGGIQHGRDETDLEFAMRWIWDKITSIVATERKTLLQGVVAFKTDGTSNEMADDPGYENITVLQELAQVLLPNLRELTDAIKPSATDRGDAISALVIATQMIDKTCKKLKYRRKIVLITNGLSEIDADDLGDICRKIQQDSIEVTVLGVDFDDIEYGFKEEDKPKIKRENEELLRKFTDDCGGVYGTLAQAVDELGEPRLKETKPVPSYRGTLTLGDRVAYENSALVIEVERYPRTMIRRPQTASSFAARRDASATQAGTATSDAVMTGTGVTDGTDPNGLAAVRNTIEYLVDHPDPSRVGEKIRVERDDLARGYEYGRTAVHISESDESITKLEMHAGLEIIGFIPWSNFERYMNMSTSNVIVGSRSNTKSVMALSSFIHALYELQSFAIAKLVTKEGKEPVVEILAPAIEPDFECLIDVQLPFAEDVRSYKFPPLDKVVTVSGKVLKEHRHLPSEKLTAAMDKYVDAMDLSEFGRDADGKPTEYLTLQDAFSPVLHRIDQAVRWRAVHADTPIPGPHEILTRYQQAPEALRERAKKQLEQLAAAAEVKEVPPRVAGRKRRDAVKPLSGLDVDALLGGPQKRAQVDPNNAIPSFKQTLDQPQDTGVINDAAEQLGAIIEKRIRDSFGDSAYEQALEELKVMRYELIDLEASGLWNEYIRGLKAKLLADELGEGREEMWYHIRKARLGLHTGRIPGGGFISNEEAKEFLSNKSSPEK